MFAAVDKNSVKAKWFALRVKSKHEKKAADLLEYSGFEAFLPLSRMRHRWSQRWKEVKLPLFPGYVFARFDRGGWARVVNVPGVIDAVRFGKALAAVEEKEIEALQLVQRTSRLVEPCAYYPAGHHIRIEDGPLSGLTGNVVEDQGFAHVILSVTLLQRSVRVKIDREFVSSDALPASGEVARPGIVPLAGLDLGSRLPSR
jgi:transcriptional antiterminator NusG